ncbi:kinase [Polynucleobacter sp. MWH-UH23A]|uniref:GHMP family kinase ATP-binding protein n=1 Tax=Polynucleobacter sp. MWH-UH23A TaxID=1855613 RepID=UPI003364F581
MIIAKTPLRISFFGGGTDIPEYFDINGGAILGFAVDKYIYHTVSRFPSELFNYSVRISYSKVECVQNTSEILHVPFREILNAMNIRRDVEIHVASDLPSFSGLGSSSAFTVGLFNALHAYKGISLSPIELAEAAIHMEREVLREAVGCQDQVFAAHGGFNLLEFAKGSDIKVQKVDISMQRKSELFSSLMLFFTGITRSAQAVEANKINNIRNISKTLTRIKQQTYDAYDYLLGSGSINQFGKMLDQAWVDKKQLDSSVSNSAIDAMYQTAISGGALGGKLLGAGGGGFLLLFVPPDKKSSVRKALKGFHEVNFDVSNEGSSIIHS